MKMIKNNFLLLLFSKRYIWSLTLFIISGISLNIAQFLIFDGNISNAGGSYVTLFALADKFNKFNYIILILIPVIVTYLVVEPSYNEKNFCGTITTRISIKKYYLYKMTSIFIFSFLLIFSFYGINAITNMILFDMRFLETNNLAMYEPGTIRLMFINIKETDIYFMFPSLLFNNVGMYGVINAIMVSIYSGIIAIFSYGCSLILNNYILKFIVPLVFIYLSEIILENIKLGQYSILNLLKIMTSNGSFTAYLFWLIILLFLGVLLIILYRRKKI